MDNPGTKTDDVAPRRRAPGAAGLLHDILDDLIAHEGAAPGVHIDAPRSEPSSKDAGHYATLGDVMDRLDERAFGLLLLLLALPCCLPFVYVLPQIAALPMLALAAQLAVGRHHPWLPGSLRNRRFPIVALQGVVKRSEKYLAFIEWFARPRFIAATGHLGSRFVGAILLIPTASILVPLPLTNSVPGIGVAIASLGIIERDGVLVILGLLIGLAWVGLLLFLGFEAADLIKDWIAARF